MGVKLLLSTCGCATLTYDAQYIIDSNYLPARDLNIGWLKFDDELITLNRTFADIEALMVYLNGDFKTEYNKAGD